MSSEQLLINSFRHDKSPKFYKKYPELFSKYFSGISSEEVKKLSKAGYYYYHSVLSLDSIIDDYNFNEIPYMLSLQEESIKVLTSIYGLHSPFWKYWNQRKIEYFEAVKIEKLLSKKEKIDFETYEDLADKKSAFGKVAIDSLFTLAKKQDKNIYKTLQLSHKYFSVGFQLYDDVQDFKDDFQNRQFNFAIYKLQKAVDFKVYKNNVSVLNKLLFIKEIGQEILSKSLEQFEKAISILNSYKIKSKWLETIIEVKGIIEKYLDTTIGYLATIETKMNIKNRQVNSYSFFEYIKVVDKTIKKGLDFIKSDFYQNYVELKHFMYLSESEGFQNDTTIHVSDIFQRALINDCFITVANAYDMDISNFLKCECDYLIKLRNKDNIGGWSYFSTVQEIAADIDDLGQVIQLFVFSKKLPFIDKYCKKAISISLDERVLSSGGIETWIIPQKSQTQIQKKQEYFNNTKWGKGPNVEIVANFLYALYLYDNKKNKDVIQNGISYILGCQNNKGYWESRWYYGNFYGTYVCLRLLKEFEKNYQKEIQKSIDYLTICQNIDGGYSIDGNSISDPLSTSFVILILNYFIEKKGDRIIRKALKYLHSTQKQDGSWEEVNFIKPKVHEPYKSKTLTTAYVLKALCSCS